MSPPPIRLWQEEAALMKRGAIEASDIPMLATPYDWLANELMRIKTEIRGMADDEKYGGHLSDKITRIERGLQDVINMLRELTPAAVCRKCDGGGCKLCRESGFWTKAICDQESMAG